MSTAIVVFTRDLRVHDNPTLAAAAAAAEHVLPLFVRDTAVTACGFSSPVRERFLDECLDDLDESLRRRGARLVRRRGDLVTEVCRLADQTRATEVHIATDASAFAVRRQSRLAAALAGQRRRLVCHDGVHSVIAPGVITPLGRDHFAVFTPYHRRWLAARPRPLIPPPVRLCLPPGLPPGEQPVTVRRTRTTWLGGETEARRRLRRWLAGDVERYAEVHDDLAADATSHLSPYLHFGCVSAVEVAAGAAARGTPGADAFLRQLAWRDFHLQVLAARPGSAHDDYRPRGRRWRRDPRAWHAWQEGRTGIPIVDAGMRQLLDQGWMHNRARLITGSFLTKTMGIDWRAGAAHFLAHLVDADLANNQLNWQWVAGTGTDTRPGRVLNPLRQAERHDPTGRYVRRWVPELAGLNDPRDVHRPWRLGPGALRALGYPAPIVAVDVTAPR